MGSLRLVLGWEQLLEADQAALPAVRGLCAALEIRTHYHDPSQTLYIEPPVLGRTVTVTTGTHDTDVYLAAAERIAEAVRQRLEQGGAGAGDQGKGAAPATADLILHISVGDITEWGVAMAYNWVRYAQNRKLAAVLAEEVSWATGLENLGARVSLAAGSQAPGTPTIEVLIGQPAPNDFGYLKEHRFLDAVAEGVFTGLSRFWASPTLEEMRERGESEPEFVLEPAPEPEPSPAPAPRLESIPLAVVEVDPDPVIDLEPQPMFPAPPPRPRPEPYADPEPDEESVLAEYAFLAASQPPPLVPPTYVTQPPPPQSRPTPTPTPTPAPRPTTHAFAWRQNRGVSKPKPLVISDPGSPVLKFP